MSFRCPRCGRVSHHPRDEEEGYCGACHDWTADAVALPDVNGGLVDVPLPRVSQRDEQ